MWIKKNYKSLSLFSYFYVHGCKCTLNKALSLQKTILSYCNDVNKTITVLV